MMTRYDTRSRAWIVAAGVCGTLVALPAPFGEQSAEADTPGFCQVRLRYYNRNRHVHGPVGTECGPIHSPPWGNWGVDSNASPDYSWRSRPRSPERVTGCDSVALQQEIGR